MTQAQTKEIKRYLDYIESQTGLSPTEVAEEMSAALESVILKNKHYPQGTRIQVHIDPSSGALEMFREWLIVDDENNVNNKEHELPLTIALKMADDISAGQTILEPLPSDILGRIAARQALQLFSKIIRDGQLTQKRKQYSSQIGNIITGSVKYAKRDHVIVDLPDQSLAILPRKNCVPREVFRENDKVSALVVNANPEYRGAVIELSRTHPDFLKMLFFNEVPEIHEGSIEIMAVSRDPGMRAKMAVKSNDKRVDPIGSCIGMRGTRVQAVSNELHGERIDIILWDKDPATMVIQSLTPGKVESIEINEIEKSMDLHVLNENLAQTIGKSGQNIKLASDLTGWILNIKKQSISEQELIDNLCSALDVDDEIASILVKNQFTSPQTIAKKGKAALIDAIEQFDDDIADVIVARAESSLLEETLIHSDMEEQYPLLKHGCINLHYATLLDKKGIRNDEDLAELSMDELKEMIPLDDDTASELIMETRKHWFEDDPD